MQFRIVSVEKLPLGTRILRPGATGEDVKTLQEQLTQNGFYFGTIDGIFGPLTQEAVLLLQRAFKLRIDGIVGNEVMAALKNPARKTGRIIYALKKKESLRSISRNFKVNPCAWDGIPGQGNPQKRIYSGMRLLLHQRALFLWNEPALKPNHDASSPKTGNNTKNEWNSTGTVGPGWTIDSNGELISQLGPSCDSNGGYLTISAAPEVWTQLVTSRDFRVKLENQLQKISGLNFGFDLSTAPLNTIPYWPKFLRQICRRLHIREHSFLVLPLILKTGTRKKTKNTREGVFFWSNIAIIAKLTSLIIFEQLPETGTPEGYLNSAAELPKTLRLLNNYRINLKSLLAVTIQCWDWNLETGNRQSIPYKKAKMIRGMNPGAAVVYPASNLTAVTYRSQRQSHCLVYQTVKEWENMLLLINQLNLLGIVIRNFEVLGGEGITAVRNCFAIMPVSSLPAIKL